MLHHQIRKQLGWSIAVVVLAAATGGCPASIPDAVARRMRGMAHCEPWGEEPVGKGKCVIRGQHTFRPAKHIREALERRVTNKVVWLTDGWTVEVAGPGASVDRGLRMEATAMAACKTSSDGARTPVVPVPSSLVGALATIIAAVDRPMRSSSPDLGLLALLRSSMGGRRAATISSPYWLTGEYREAGTGMQYMDMADRVPSSVSE